MDKMIDFLRDHTIFARHSRAETRDFLERLDVEGMEIVAKAKPVEPAEEDPIVEA